MGMAEDLLPAILGAGGAGFIAACVQAYRSFKDGAEAREARAVANLERWREGAEARAERLEKKLETERRWGNYWRLWAGMLEYVIVKAGLPLPPRPPEPRDVAYGEHGVTPTSDPNGETRDRDRLDP